MKKLAVEGLFLLFLVTMVSISISSNVPQTSANTAIEAKVQMDPRRFGPFRTVGEDFTFIIELPSGYDVGDIDVPSIVLNGIVEYESGFPAVTGDYDEDGIPDLAVTFPRDSVLTSTDIGGFEWFFHGRRAFKSTMIISGSMTDASLFSGSCTLLVIWPKIRPL